MQDIWSDPYLHSMDRISVEIGVSDIVFQEIGGGEQWGGWEVKRNLYEKRQRVRYYLAERLSSLWI